MREKYLGELKVLERVDEPFPRLRSWQNFLEILPSVSQYVGGLRSSRMWDKYGHHIRTIQMAGDELQTPILSQMNGADEVLTENLFPYDVLTDAVNESLVCDGLRVEHLLVWSRNGELNEKVVSNMLAGVEDLKDWVAFVQPSRDRSIQSLAHCHVFVLRDI